jgi:hypothetical protein
MFGQQEQCTEPPMLALPFAFSLSAESTFIRSKEILCAPTKDTPATDILMTEES